MIYFVRHGETDWNKKAIMQGQIDIPLNKTGIEQANELKEKLKNTKIDVIYSSPLSRALETAQIINEYHNVQLITDDRIKEHNGGKIQGTKKQDHSKEYIEKYYQDPKSCGAEDWNEFYDRVISLFNEIEKSNKNILIVSHGGVYRNIHKYLHNIDRYDFEFEQLNNCDVRILKN